MKEFDRVLVGISIGGFLLVASVFALLFLGDSPEYHVEDGPEAVIHNYLLAIQNENYERAYSYLSHSLSGYPRNAGLFQYRVENAVYAFSIYREVSLVVEGAKSNGENATVYVRETRYYRDDLLINSQRERAIHFDLVAENNSWKIVDGSSYFLSCWTSLNGCH